MTSNSLCLYIHEEIRKRDEQEEWGEGKEEIGGEEEKGRD